MPENTAKAPIEYGRGHLWVMVMMMVVLLGSNIALMSQVDAFPHGDIRLYRRIGADLLAGTLPYRDRTLEYPPYAIPIFLAPWLFAKDLFGYQFAFATLVGVMDSLLKSILLWEGFKCRRMFLGLLPLALYCLGVIGIRDFYFQRYDIFPALLTLAAVCCFFHSSYAWAGAILAIAAGVKLYPALLWPIIWALALRRGAGMPFAVGSALAMLPMALLSIWLPWWKFLMFHGDRGLQCESIYAAVIWLAQLNGMAEARWTFLKAWTEVTGPVALGILPWAKLLMASTTLGAVAFASWAAWRAPNVNLCQLCRICLIPLLAFVGFNIVLSPQFMIWLLPLAALGILRGPKWPMVLIAVCTAVTPVFSPLSGNETGLNLFQTLVLLGRNVSLIVVWVVLIGEFWRMIRQPSPLAILASNAGE